MCEILKRRPLLILNVCLEMVLFHKPIKLAPNRLYVEDRKVPNESVCSSLYCSQLENESSSFKHESSIMEITQCCYRVKGNIMHYLQNLMKNLLMQWSWASPLILFSKIFFCNNFYCSVGRKARYFYTREKSLLSKLSLARTQKQAITPVEVELSPDI